MQSTAPPIYRDSTLALWRDPYRFISRRAHQTGQDSFSIRLLSKPVLCLTGPQAPQFFYDTERFQRDGAMPSPIRSVLFGEGAVQGLDDDAHRHRKSMFMEIMAEENLDRLDQAVEEELHAQVVAWPEARDLTQALEEVLTSAACRWMGIELTENEIKPRARLVSRLFRDAGSVGSAHFLARGARQSLERWMEDQITAVRTNQVQLDDHLPLCIIAGWRDHEGRLLSGDVAAVEALNILRPIVAVSVFGAFLARAMCLYQDRVPAGEAGDAAIRCFVQEVRRTAPFFPMVAARTRQNLEWQGEKAEQGQLVLLDIWGINHDGRIWKQPEDFDPSRFADREIGMYDMIPQGGGDHFTGHRCAGEWITERLMALFMRMLLKDFDWSLDAEKLELDWARLPALPPGGVVVRNLKSRNMVPRGIPRCESSIRRTRR